MGINAKCANFPLAENLNKNISVVGFAAKNFPCGGDKTNIEICLIFDKCGSFGFSIGGGALTCLANSISSGGPLSAQISPLLSQIWEMKIGYSNKRQWVSEVELMDIKTNEEIRALGMNPEGYFMTKKITLRSHIYIGSKFAFPKTGIKIGDKDISEIITLTIEGKFFVDFGEKNSFAPENIKATIENKQLNPIKKFETFVKAAREYSINASGSFSLKLLSLTNQLIPNFTIFEKSDLNVLINLGSFAGNKGSSGLNPGFHLYFKPPQFNSKDINPIIKFMETQINTMRRVLKIGRKSQEINLPRIPNLKGTEIGIYVGKDIRIKFDIVKNKKKLFEMLCIFSLNRREKTFKHECEFGADYVSIIQQKGKIFLAKGKKTLKSSKDSFMNFKLPLFNRNFSKIILNKAKEIYEKLKNAAKKALDYSKKNLANLQLKTKKALLDLKKAKENVFNFINKVGDKMKDFFINLVKNLDEQMAKLLKKNKSENKMIDSIAEKLSEMRQNIINMWVNSDKKQRAIREKEAENFSVFEEEKIEAEILHSNLEGDEELQEEEVIKREKDYESAVREIEEL